MERKLITCPETGHLEEVELDRTPAGLVVAGCSRFTPRCAVDCPRTCAQRMDRREQLETDVRERVLVVFTAKHGATKLIAEVLADYLTNDGMTVELANAEDDALPPAVDYDAVVFASPIHRGRHARSIVGYIREHRDALAKMPSFLVMVTTASRCSESHRDLARLTDRTGWHPTDATAFATAPHWPDVHEFALRIAEQIPAALVQTSFA